MPETRTRGGLLVTLPEGYELLEVTTRPAGPRRRAGGDAVPPIEGEAAESPADVLVSALEEQDMAVLDAFEVPLPAEPLRRRGGEEPAEPGPAMVQAVLPADEDAVLLVEEDGVFHWELPESHEERPVRTRSASDSPLVPPTERVVTFRLASEWLAPRPAVRRRGLGDALGELVLGRARAWVLRFAARRALGGLLKVLERKVRTGLVLIGSSDPAQWLPLDTLAGRGLPADRPARVLLLLHGTFSSTVGSFGALGAHPEGKGLLRWAQGAYDLVLGFDHRTLSEDPEENATQLLAALESAGWPLPPHIDAVCFSRGGLVYRTLAEILLPGQPCRPTLGSAIFVGCTNAGTELARPENWRELLDLYTNLVVAATRLLQFVPQVAFGARVLREAVRSLGAFAKYLVQEAITEEGAPGLAAMEPGGRFVTALNRPQQGQTTALETNYYAVTSDFEPGADGPAELPSGFVRRLADGVIDRLMRAPSDWVVDVGSMSAFDPEGGTWIDDRLDFGENGLVYHTVYFQQPSVAVHVERWLRGAVATDVLVVEPDRPVADVRAMIDELDRGGEYGRHPYVVIDREPGRVALSAREFSARVDESYGSAAADRTLVVDDVKLSDLPVAREATVAEVHRAARRGGASVASGGRDDVWNRRFGAPGRPTREASPAEPVVVMNRGAVVGVLEPPTTPVAPPEEAAAAPDAPEGRPTGGEAPAVAAEKVPCHVYAEMPDEVILGVTADVIVQISREAVQAVLDSVTGSDQFKADPTRELLVDLVPYAHCEVVGERQVKLALPSPGRPHRLIFQVRPTHAGQGEVWVVVRQGPAALVTIVLEPQFLAAKGGGGGQGAGRAGRTTGRVAVAAAEPPPKPFFRLSIYDRHVGNDVQFEYVLELPDGSRPLYSTPVISNREAVIASLYTKIESFYALHAHDFDAFMMDLRSFGGWLFQQLLPRQLQELLWRDRNQIDVIQIFSAEPFIPWELLLLRPPDGPLPPTGTCFLAEYGVVRWLHNVPGPLRILRRPGRAVYVIPDYPQQRLQLPGAKQEKALLSSLWNAEPLKPEDSPSVYRLLRNPGELDLLHFACHGEATSTQIPDAVLLMTGRMEGKDYRRDTVPATTVGQLTAFGDGTNGGPRPLVFLNACQIGRVSGGLTKLGGFAEAFLSRGAGAFVGTLWSVGDNPALTFAEEFYRTLNSGATVVAATRAARLKAQSALDVTWLAYVVYADPYARLAPVSD